MPYGVNLIYMDLIGPNYSQLIPCGYDWLCDIRIDPYYTCMSQYGYDGTHMASNGWVWS